MTDKLMMRSLLCNVGFIARSQLPEPSQNILAKMNKVLLCSIEEKCDQAILDEFRAFLASMEVGDSDDNINALFYFLAQSLLISFSKMTDKLMMRSLLCNVGFIARSLLPEPSQSILAKMNKLLLCVIEQKLDQGILDELRTFLASMDVGDSDDNLNALFYFLAQSLLISFSHRKSNKDGPDTSTIPHPRDVVELETEESKPEAFIEQNSSVEMPAVEHDEAEPSIDRSQTPKSEPLDDEELEVSKAAESSEQFDGDATSDETTSSKAEAQEYDFEETMDDEEEEEEEEESPSNAGESPTIRCPFCPATRAADNIASIQKHIFKKHEFTGSLFKCIKCNIALNSATHLKGCSGPMVFHYDPEQQPRFRRKSSIIPGRACPICKERLASRMKNGVTTWSLSNHLTTKHKETKGTFFRCSKCANIRSRCSSHLQRHFKATTCGGEAEFFYCGTRP